MNSIVLSGIATITACCVTHLYVLFSTQHCSYYPIHSYSPQSYFL
jgi:hypothetical protein